MHHKISLRYNNVDSTLAVTLVGGDSGEKLKEEQMCEAKMEPETAGSDHSDVKSPVVSLTDKGGCGNNNNNNIQTSGKGIPLTPASHDHDDEVSSDDLISVGGSPSSPDTSTTISRTHPEGCGEDDYFRPLKKLRMLQMESASQSNAPGLKSFSISDILSHKPATAKSTELVIQQRIVRPWDPQSKSNGRRNSSDSSPLDALFQMTSKTFEGLNGHHDNSELGRGGDHQMFSARQPPKKKRKSRTAFTNHQIFELEKRFLYQKYLSPADRDDIAQQLGLTNAQVITWFQNRRAKLKRDMEELKKDVESAKLLSAHKSFLESAHDLGLLKKRPQSQMDMNAATVASYHIASPTSSSQSSHSPINLTSESPPSTH